MAGVGGLVGTVDWVGYPCGGGVFVPRGKGKGGVGGKHKYRSALLAMALAEERGRDLALSASLAEHSAFAEFAALTETAESVKIQSAAAHRNLAATAVLLAEL